MTDEDTENSTPSILDDPIYVPARIEAGSVPAAAIVYRLDEDDPLHDEYLLVVNYPRHNDHDHVADYAILVPEEAYTRVTDEMALSLDD